MKTNKYICEFSSEYSTVTFVENYFKTNLKLPYYHISIKPGLVLRSDLDCFQFIPENIIKLIQEKSMYILFDWNDEGFSPFDHKLFDFFYYNCEKYNIDPGMFIYISSNLKDNQNIISYIKRKKKKSINVLGASFFEHWIDNYSFLNSSIDKNFYSAKEKCIANYDYKIAASLSRSTRDYRTLALFLLSKSKLKNHYLISHNKITSNDFIEQLLTQKEKKQFKKWVNKLPLIIDSNKFNNNWSIDEQFVKIFDKTIFHIVNETHVDNFNNTSLFYTEKTAKPILCFQPFVIYGQVGCNHYLKDLGYMTYDDWFDLSFDWEEDPVLRYQKLLKSVTDAGNEILSMSREKQIEWRFKNSEVLKYNYNKIVNDKTVKDVIINFIKTINNET